MRNQVLGQRYRVLEKIGEGGMAYVYLALDEKLGRKVAIKVLHEHMERNAEIRKRFLGEAQAISTLEHPNIVKIFDVSGDRSERLWIVTEVLRGRNLAQFVQQFTGGFLHPVVAACIVREITKALSAAHMHGIVHRDIKPENVMVNDDGRIKLMDFGIAKDLGKTSMTLTGTFMGSPSYMSPEQIRGRDVDLRSDLYSLGVLFYEIVTGRLPFTGQSTHDVVMKIMEGEFTHPRYVVPTLPDRLNDLIVKGMAKNAMQRFRSAGELGESLDRFLNELGFDESHIELERFVRDRRAYAERLAKAQASLLRASTLAMRMSRAGGVRTTQPAAGSNATTAHLAPLPPTPVGPLGSSTGRPQARLDKSPEGRSGSGSGLQSVVGRPAADARPLATSRFSTDRDFLPRQAGQQAAIGLDTDLARQVPRAPTPRQRASTPRRNSTYGAPPDFIAQIMGTVVVSAITLMSVWGFWILQGRIAARTQAVAGGASRPAVSAQTPETPSSNPTEVDDAPKPSRPSYRRNGTPIVVKNISRKPPSPTALLPQRTPRPARPIGTHPTRPPGRHNVALAQPTPVSNQEAPTNPPLAPPSGPAAVAIMPVTKGTKSRLIIASQPAAEVFIDGKRVGTTIDNTTNSGWRELSPGRHALELRRQGYATWRATVDLAEGEQRTMPRVELASSGGAVEADLSNALTLRVSVYPADVTIRNLENSQTQSFTMKGPTRVVKLDNGRYLVKVQYKGATREREVILNSSQGQLTFSAEFKDEGK